MLQGGRYLVVREGLGIVVRTGGVLLLTRLIGPEQYGLFAGSLFLVLFCTALATTGLDLFLNRRSGEVADDWYHQVFSSLLVSSLAVTTVGVALAGVAGDVVGDERIVAPLRVLLLSIPLNILWIPARSRLERAFRFRPLVISEVGADVVQYLLAIGLALAGAGVWAAVYGFLARQAFMLASSYVLARYVPRWRWRGELLREVYGFGVPMCAIAVVRRAGDLVIPLVVGRYLGASAIGVVALAVRLVETASFVSRATARLSVVALGRVQKDLPRLRVAVEEGMALQVLTVAPVLVAFSVFGSLLLPPLLGQEWVDVTRLLPFIAVSYVLIALLTTPTTALMVLGRRWTLVGANVASTGIFFGVALFLVPRLGLFGYALAQISSMSAMWLKNREIHRIAGVRSRRALPWLVAMLPLLLLPLLPWYGILTAPLPLLIVLCVPAPRRELITYVRAVREVGGRASR